VGAFSWFFIDRRWLFWPSVSEQKKTKVVAIEYMIVLSTVVSTLLLVGMI
jgi:hypothetical protein